MDRAHVPWRQIGVASSDGDPQIGACSRQAANQLARLASGDVGDGACVDYRPFGLLGRNGYRVTHRLDLPRHGFDFCVVEFAAQCGQKDVHAGFACLHVRTNDTTDPACLQHSSPSFKASARLERQRRGVIAGPGTLVPPRNGPSGHGPVREKGEWFIEP